MRRNKFEILDELKSLNRGVTNYLKSLCYKEMLKVLKNEELNSYAMKDIVKYMHEIHLIEDYFDNFHSLFITMDDYFMSIAKFYKTDLIYDYLYIINHQPEEFYYYLRETGSWILSPEVGDGITGDESRFFCERVKLIVKLNRRGNTLYEEVRV